MTQPRRPDQEYNPPGTPVSPSAAGGILRARLVIVSGPGGGVFVYDPAPGPNELVAAIAGQLGTDSFHNAYPAGITSFGTSGFFVNMISGAIYFQDGASTVSQGWVQASGGGVLSLASPTHGTDSTAELGLFSGAKPVIYSSAILVPDPFIAAQQPGQPPATPEIWHHVVGGAGFQHGWTDRHATQSTYPPTAYQLLANGDVEINLHAVAGTLANGTVIWTMPSDYIPTFTQICPLAVDASGALDSTTGSPTLLIRGASEVNPGDVQVYNLGTVTTRIHNASAGYSLTGT